MTTRVILADDHRIVREGLRGLLDDQPGIEVVGETGDGCETVQRALELSPDVVVMDVTMPGYNGVEATRRILAENPDIRVIALSVHSERHFVAGMLSAGATAYLLKDCASEELVQAIKTTVAGQIYLSPEVAQNAMTDYLKFLSHPSPLTARQKEILHLIAEGKTIRETAALLHLSPKTVEMHRKNIMSKLDIRSIAELTKYAIREGLTALDT
ncbi:MAG: response regulator transcription factor [Kiritimatiellia bacterium]|jgi:DNA-binding NarL/FixJ family response regulator|nr:response regulator transcription factor [Kiritimatiellia bacterium]